MASKENSRTGSQGGNKNPGNFANDREKHPKQGAKAARALAAAQQQ